MYCNGPGASQRAAANKKAGSQRYYAAPALLYYKHSPSAMQYPIYINSHQFLPGIGTLVFSGVDSYRTAGHMSAGMMRAGLV